MADVVVVAHWRTTAEALEDVLALVDALRPQALAEAGCLGYEAFQSVEDRTHLLLVERYRDRDALDAHVASDHYQRIVVGQIRPLLTGRDVEVLAAAAQRR